MSTSATPTQGIGKSPIDPKLIAQLEEHASAAAEDLNVMLKNLQSKMFEASNLTCASFDVYDQTVTNHGVAIETAITKAQDLIDKCDALDKEFANVQTLANQIKSIRQQVDALQHAIK